VHRHSCCVLGSLSASSASLPPSALDSLPHSLKLLKFQLSNFQIFDTLLTPKFKEPQCTRRSHAIRPYFVYILIMPSLLRTNRLRPSNKTPVEHSIVYRNTHDDTTQRLLDPKFDLAIRQRRKHDIPRMGKKAAFAISSPLDISSKKLTGPESRQESTRSNRRPSAKPSAKKSKRP